MLTFLQYNTLMLANFSPANLTAYVAIVNPALTSHVLNNIKISSLQCYSVLSDILVKNKLCISLERGSNVLSTGKGFICLSPPSKL